MWTCSFAGDGSSDGTFSGIEIKGIDNNNIYVGMQRNNAKDGKIIISKFLIIKLNHM